MLLGAGALTTVAAVWAGIEKLGINRMSLTEADNLAMSLSALRAHAIRTTKGVRTKTTTEEDVRQAEALFTKGVNRLMEDGYAWLVIDMVNTGQLPNEGPLTQNLLRQAARRFLQDIKAEGRSREIVLGLRVAHRSTDVQAAVEIYPAVVKRAQELARRGSPPPGAKRGLPESPGPQTPVADPPRTNKAADPGGFIP